MATIIPRSTIFIDGGATSMTYTTTLTVKKGGTSDTQRIIIQRSEESGHNGIVNASYVYIDYPYVTLDGRDRNRFIIKATGGYIVRIPPNGNYVQIKNISLLNTFSTSWGTPLYGDSQHLTLKAF
ncbi:MAG: hypothetical protein IT292_03800 [Deltaproteobacteria bacterium]|nr:hypothetical protein [Deltaproteobacteria bacterium]